MGTAKQQNDRRQEVRHKCTPESGSDTKEACVNPWAESERKLNFAKKYFADLIGQMGIITKPWFETNCIGDWYASWTMYFRPYAALCYEMSLRILWPNPAPLCDLEGAGTTECECYNPKSGSCDSCLKCVRECKEEEAAGEAPEPEVEMYAGTDRMYGIADKLFDVLGTKVLSRDTPDAKRSWGWFMFLHDWIEKGIDMRERLETEPDPIILSMAVPKKERVNNPAHYMLQWLLNISALTDKEKTRFAEEFWKAVDRQETQRTPERGNADGT